MAKKDKLIWFSEALLCGVKAAYFLILQFIDIVVDGWFLVLFHLLN